MLRGCETFASVAEELTSYSLALGMLNRPSWAFGLAHNVRNTDS